jgi:predicted nucleic acid-binding protein
MVKALFDTGVLVDYLSGRKEARAELGRYESRAISIVSWMEVLDEAPSDSAEATRRFLDSFQIIPVAPAVAEIAMALKRTHAMTLPDALIWASARLHGLLLVTCDLKNFPPDDPGIRFPYRFKRNLPSALAVPHGE